MHEMVTWRVKQTGSAGQGDVGIGDTGKREGADVVGCQGGEVPESSKQLQRRLPSGVAVLTTRHFG